MILDRFKFHHIKEHLTHDHLNEGYGDKGHTFKTLKEARLFLSNLKNKGLRIYKIVNHKWSDVEEVCVTENGLSRKVGTKIREGALPHVTGYLVSN